LIDIGFHSRELRMATRYYLSLPDPSRCARQRSALAFDAHGPDEFAAQLQEALRTTALFERWRQAAGGPDGV
jgi:hypothetical protein